MEREVVLFKSKEVMGRDQVAAFLRQLADKVESGNVTLQSGQQELPLTLPADLQLEVEVEDEQKSRGIEHCLEVEIKWYDDGVTGPRGGVSLK